MLLTGKRLKKQKRILKILLNFGGNTMINLF